MSTRNIVASELPLVLDVLSDDLEIVFFFLEKATIASFKLLQHPHFVRETSNQHPHFFLRCSSGGSTLECERKTQVPTTKRNSVADVLKRPPTLPTSKDAHSNDKHFGNLPPSFRSLAFFLRSITVKSRALYEWTNGSENYGNSGKSGKKEIP